jgi:hypothetical protein
MKGMDSSLQCWFQVKIEKNNELPKMRPLLLFFQHYISGFYRYSMFHNLVLNCFIKTLFKNSLAPLLCLLYISGGLLIFSPTILDIHRYSFQEKISSTSRSVAFSFTNEEFNRINWNQENREFNLMGKLYDVKSIQRSSTGVRIECVNDEDEEALVAIIDSWKKSLPFCKTKIRLQPPLLERNVLNTSDPFAVPPHSYSSHSPFYDSQVIELTSPPPERVS